jgi:hypothetical protein
VQEDADRVFAQGLVAEEQRGVVEERGRRERERVERERVERERVERETMERGRREEMVRRKMEEEASEKTVGGTTKPCPGCKAPIEKNLGWEVCLGVLDFFLTDCLTGGCSAHMTCKLAPFPGLFLKSRILDAQVSRSKWTRNGLSLGTNVKTARLRRSQVQVPVVLGVQRRLERPT